MVVYEVNLAVDREIAEPFETWLHEHVEKMLAIDGFRCARVYLEESPEPDPVRYCVHYRLASRDALEAYFKDHAERMRHDGLERFPGRFSATRRVLAEAGT